MKELYERLKPMILSKKESNTKKLLIDCRGFLFSCLQRLILSILIDSDWEATSDFMDNIDTFSKQSDIELTEVFKKSRENFEKYMQEKQQSIDILTLTEKLLPKMSTVC